MTWRTSGWPGFGPNNFRGSVNVADGNVNVAGDLNLTDSAAFTTTLQCITPTANRTVSIPDATGTLGLIAGSSGNLIWNNAGAYVGALNSTVDSSGNITIGGTLTSSGRLINSIAAALSAPPVSVTGAWVTTGGTATTTKPTVVIEPTGTTSTGWSTAGTGLGVNAPSGFAGNLADLQLNGSRVFRVASDGSALISGAGAVGYATGSGGAVTQATSRTTGVTLNKTNGAITLVSAAGTTTWQSFTVTNSTVATTDVIKVCQKSGTDKYVLTITNVGAGSFEITYQTTGGTTTEQPVFNFSVIKAVTA